MSKVETSEVTLTVLFLHFSTIVMTSGLPVPATLARLRLHVYHCTNPRNTRMAVIYRSSSVQQSREQPAMKDSITAAEARHLDEVLAFPSYLYRCQVSKGLNMDRIEIRRTRERTGQEPQERDTPGGGTQ